MEGFGLYVCSKGEEYEGEYKDENHYTLHKCCI